MKFTASSFSNAVFTEVEDILTEIHAKDKNIAVLHRSIKPLLSELSILGGQEIKFQANGTVEEVKLQLKKYFYWCLNGSESVCSDLIKQLSLFGKLTNASSFKLQFFNVTTDMCRRFHSDTNDLRLLCTYMGPGTLWLPQEAVDYSAYERGEWNDKIVTDGNLIQKINTGDVVVLKGTLYPGTKAVLHRSPSIEEDSGKRLVLRIDTNEPLIL